MFSEAPTWEPPFRQIWLDKSLDMPTSAYKMNLKYFKSTIKYILHAYNY